jgi:hypothetical protein
MNRSIAAAVAVVTVLAAPAASACSCIGHPSQAAAEKAGARAYAAADMIVDATVGGPPGSYRRICCGAGGKPRRDVLGRTFTPARSLIIHRILKGRPPVRAMLAGATTQVRPEGCAVLQDTCTPVPNDGSRQILVLRRLADGRYASLSFCEITALRNSRRGQALFTRGR